MLVLSKRSNCVHRNMVRVGDYFENDDYQLKHTDVEIIHTDEEVQQMISDALDSADELHNATFDAEAEVLEGRIQELEKHLNTIMLKLAEVYPDVDVTEISPNDEFSVISAYLKRMSG